MRRLIQTGDPLYLPITQDPVPKTEDQLEEDAQVMMQLGTDKYASEMRARMMSASLLSDMESFKVAHDRSRSKSNDMYLTIFRLLRFVLHNARRQIPARCWRTLFDGTPRGTGSTTKESTSGDKERVIILFSCRRISENMPNPRLYVSAREILVICDYMKCRPPVAADVDPRQSVVDDVGVGTTSSRAPAEEAVR